MPNDCLRSLTLSPATCAQDKTRVFRGPTNLPYHPTSIGPPGLSEVISALSQVYLDKVVRDSAPLSKTPGTARVKEGRAIRCGPTQRHSFSCCGGGLAAGLLKLVLWSHKVPARRFSHGGKKLSFFSSLVPETRLSISAIEFPWTRLLLREPIPSTSHPVRPSVLRPAQWYKDARPRCPK